MHWLTIQPKTLYVDNYLFYAIEEISNYLDIEKNLFKINFFKINFFKS